MQTIGLVICEGVGLIICEGVGLIICEGLLTFAGKIYKISP